MDGGRKKWTWNEGCVHSKSVNVWQKTNFTKPYEKKKHPKQPIEKWRRVFERKLEHEIKQEWPIYKWKVRQAARCKVRPHRVELVKIGDQVYYKKEKEDEWKVIGKDRRVILLKQGGTLRKVIRVHII